MCFVGRPTPYKSVVRHDRIIGSAAGTSLSYVALNQVARKSCSVQTTYKRCAGCIQTKINQQEKNKHFFFQFMCVEVKKKVVEVVLKTKPAAVHRYDTPFILQIHIYFFLFRIDSCLVQCTKYIHAQCDECDESGRPHGVHKYDIRDAMGTGGAL